MGGRILAELVAQNHETPTVSGEGYVWSHRRERMAVARMIVDVSTAATKKHSSDKITAGKSRWKKRGRQKIEVLLQETKT